VLWVLWWLGVRALRFFFFFFFFFEEHIPLLGR